MLFFQEDKAVLRPRFDASKTDDIRSSRNQIQAVPWIGRRERDKRWERKRFGKSEMTPKKDQTYRVSMAKYCLFFHKSNIYWPDNALKNPFRELSKFLVIKSS